MSISARKMLVSTAALSDFDIKTTYSSRKLINIAKDMSTVSESNLAIVEDISESMEEIKEATTQINIAMDASAKDVEKLNHMTQEIHADAIESAENAKQISEIDTELSQIIKEMISSLNGGRNAISNEELIDNLVKIKEAHGRWIVNLKKIAGEMRIYPLQTDSKRCTFGHFYHSINLTHVDVIKDWTAIDKVHHELHSMGTKIVNSVNSNNKILANDLYLQTEKLSKEIFQYVDNTIRAIEKNPNMEWKC